MENSKQNFIFNLCAYDVSDDILHLPLVSYAWRIYCKTWGCAFIINKISSGLSLFIASSTRKEIYICFTSFFISFLQLVYVFTWVCYSVRGEIMSTVMSFNNRNFSCCWGGSKKKASSKEWNGELSRAQPIFWYSNFTNYLLALSDVVQSYLNTKIDKIIYTKSSRFFYNLEKKLWKI